MAGYHSFELAYLAAVYTNLLIRNEPMDFYFRPDPGLYLGGTERSEVKMDAFVVAGTQNLLIPIVQQREETIELVD